MIWKEGSKVYNGHATQWVGEVGLMYLSDYGYATGGGNISRDVCLNLPLYDWHESDCNIMNWLYKSTEVQWTIVPNSMNNYLIYYIYSSGRVNEYSANSFYANGVRPVVYLDTNIKIKNGTGSSQDPFILSL